MWQRRRHTFEAQYIPQTRRISKGRGTDQHEAPASSLWPKRMEVGGKFYPSRGFPNNVFRWAPYTLTEPSVKKYTRDKSCPLLSDRWQISAFCLGMEHATPCKIVCLLNWPKQGTLLQTIFNSIFSPALHTYQAHHFPHTCKPFLFSGNR